MYNKVAIRTVNSLWKHYFTCDVRADIAVQRVLCSYHLQNYTYSTGENMAAFHGLSTIIKSKHAISSRNVTIITSNNTNNNAMNIIKERVKNYNSIHT